MNVQRSILSLCRVWRAPHRYAGSTPSPYSQPSDVAQRMQRLAIRADTASRRFRSQLPRALIAVLYFAASLIIGNALEPCVAHDHCGTAPLKAKLALETTVEWENNFLDAAWGGLRAGFCCRRAVVLRIPPAGSAVARCRRLGVSITPNERGRKRENESGDDKAQ